MRWSDEYLGLVAATLGLGAAVLWAAGVGWLGPAAALILAGAVLADMAWRSARTARVLLVAEPRGEPLYRLREDLDEAGFGLRLCPGPGRRPCPVLEGKPCPVPGAPVAAVVFREAGRAGAVPPCGAALEIPVLRVEEASEGRAWLDEDGARIGWRRGPGAATQAVEALVGLWPPRG